MSFHPINIVKPVTVSFLVFTILFLSSCQKVIDVDIRNAEKKYVIEGVITDQPNMARVLISTTKNISEDNNFPGISGAAVTITDNLGNATTFSETTAGIYTAASLIATTGRTYKLEVKINGELFTASSVMPQKISLDTLYITNELLFGETRKLANISYQDPPGKGQCYRYVQYINGKKGKPVFVNNDDYSDGKYVESKLWYLADDDIEEEKIKTGDTVTIDMLCIDPAVYKYWYSLNQSATGNSQSASPANPVTNINGGALGYFSAHTIQSKTVVVP